MVATIAISLTAKQGAISRIVPTLDRRARAVTSHGLVRYVVTEYGIAYLHGKSIRERAKSLIEIAHPDFRNQLYEYCEKTKWRQNPRYRLQRHNNDECKGCGLGMPREFRKLDIPLHTQAPDSRQTVTP